MDINYDTDDGNSSDDSYPRLSDKPFIEEPSFFFKKFINSIAEDITYETIEVVFRREFPFGYPGINGERSIKHNWKTRSGNSYFTYKICRHCFDIRVDTSEHTPEKAVQTFLCAPCRLDPVKSRHYWDAIYTTICTCPLIGDKFAHCINWKLDRLGYNNVVSQVVTVRCRAKIQDRLRNKSLTEPLISAESIDSDSDSL